MKHSCPPRFRSRRHTLLRSLCPAVALALVIGGSSAKAATLTWDPAQTPTTGSYGSGTWDTATTADWSNGTADQTFGSGNTALFGGTATGNPTPVNLGSPISAVAADFTAPGYTINSSTTNTLTLNSAGGTGATSAIYANGTGGTTSFTGPVTFGAGAQMVTANTATDVINFGGGAVTQTTPGTATLTTAGLGTINYSGTSFVPGKFNINNAVFNSSGTVTVANQTYFGIDSATGATLNITGGTFAATAVSTFVGAGTTAAPAPGTLNISGGTNTFTALNVGNGFNGTGDGNGTVTVSGGTNTVSGIIRLGSTDAGVGTLNLNTGGRIVINNAAGQIVRGTGTSGAGGSGNLNFNGGVLQYNTAPTVPAIAANITTTILDGGATISTNGFNVTIASPIGHGGVAAIDGGLTKAANAGVLTLTAANTYTGATTINGGTLAIGVNGGLSSSNVTIAAGATLSLAATVTAAHNNVNSILTLTGTTSVVNLLAAAGTVQDTVGTLIVNGVTEPAGTYGSATSGAVAADQLAAFTGTGEIVVTGAVPEPSTWVMMLGGLGGLVAFARRKRRA